MGRLIAEMNEDYGQVELEYIPNFRGGYETFLVQCTRKQTIPSYTDDNGVNYYIAHLKALDLDLRVLEAFYSLPADNSGYFYIESDDGFFKAAYRLDSSSGSTIIIQTPNNLSWLTFGKTYRISFPKISCGLLNNIICEYTNPSNIFDAYPYVYISKKMQQSYDGEIYTTLKIEDDYIGKDNQIEQGITYEYNWSKTKPEMVAATGNQVVDVDFEDIFLSDAEHSLRIRYNPQVSAFKTIIQEQKIETMGRQYPIFVRNGNIRYREIGLSGLISYSMDDWFYFNGQLKDEEVRPTTPDNTVENYKQRTSRDEFYLERQFKLAVEQWLNNGKPKLFRSAAEGNYLIRLMNVSLSPENKLARRLHSFSATGYEIADLNFDNLKLYNMNASDKYEAISVIAGLNTFGKVRSNSNLSNTARIEADGTLRLNTISFDKFTEGTIEPVEGDIISPPENPMTDIATNENLGGVQSSSQKNEISVDEDGNMEINALDFALWAQEEDTNYVIGDVGQSSGFAAEPTGTNWQGQLSLVKGSYDFNSAHIDADGEMIVNSITDDNIYIPADLVIGEV